LPLEKGDIIRTDSEGIAKIVFADGTNYTVKQDSLIVVEDNSTNAAQQTQVAVQVTTGTVDLTTANLVYGSKSQVTVAVVTAMDAKGKESIESEKNRFTVIPKGSADVQLALELDDFSQQGHVIIVKGKTEAGARVMVNGQEVPSISEDGTFTYYTPQLPT